MAPTPEQLRELYIIRYELTAQLRCYIRLVEQLPNQDLCVVAHLRDFTNQRMITYIALDGGRRYV